MQEQESRRPHQMLFHVVQSLRLTPRAVRKIGQFTFKRISDISYWMVLSVVPWVWCVLSGDCPAPFCKLARKARQQVENRYVSECKCKLPGTLIRLNACSSVGVLQCDSCMCGEYGPWSRSGNWSTLIFQACFHQPPRSTYQLLL